VFQFLNFEILISRPLWRDNQELASEEFKLKERDAFLDWRRKFAEYVRNRIA
jgi:hypothetical protein